MTFRLSPRACWSAAAIIALAAMASAQAVGQAVPGQGAGAPVLPAPPTAPPPAVSPMPGFTPAQLPQYVPPTLPQPPQAPKPILNPGGRESVSSGDGPGSLGRTLYDTKNVSEAELNSLRFGDIWKNWWEVNRDPYLKPREGTLTGKHAPVAPANVVAALSKAATSRDAATRAYAILSLGLIRNADSLPLLQAALKDQNQTVRLRAWAAIGLLNTRQAAIFLEKATTPTPPDQLGWLLAVGLHEQPTDATWNNVLQRAQQTDNIDIQRMVVWVMRIHQPPVAHELLLKIVHETKDPALFAEAMVGLGDIGDEQDLPLFAEVLRPPAQPQMQVLTDLLADDALRDVSRMARDPSRMSDVLAPAASSLLWIQAVAAETVSRFPKVSDPAQDALRAPLVGTMRSYISRLGGVPSLIVTNDDPFTTALVERMVGLGRIGDMDDIGFICSAADPLTVVPTSNQLGNPGGVQTPPIIGDPGINQVGAIPMNPAGARPGANLQPTGPIVPDTILVPPGTQVDVIDAARSAVRQSSLIAIALYLRQHGGRDSDLQPSPASGKQTPAVSQILRTIYANPGDLASIRAECAVAMGIAGDTRDALSIKQAMEHLEKGQEIVAGYGVLALGMLGDEDALEWGATFLGSGRSAIDMVQINKERAALSPTSRFSRIVSARRAAVDGLGALGDPRAIPILIGQWGGDDYTSIEAARAIGWCRRSSTAGPDRQPNDANLIGGFSDALVDLLVKPSSPSPLSPVAAMSLGYLWDQNASARLSLINAGENYNIVGKAATTNGNLSLLPEESPTSWGQRPILLLANPYYYARLVDPRVWGLGE